MRDPERIDEILDLLKVYWKTYPDLRLGQLVDNISYIATGQQPYYVEDEDFRIAIKKMLNHYK